jgi:glucans biosynthesis protein
LRKLPADAVVQGVLSMGGTAAAAPGAELLEQQVIRNPVTGAWRMVFQLRIQDDPIELRAFLRHGEDVLTETWSYLLVP